MIKGHQTAVTLNCVEANPFRDLNKYPFVESKLVALRSSIKDMGLLPTIIGRDHPTKRGIVQIAAGHHRIRAARDVLPKSAYVTINCLPFSDEDMIRWLGHENMDDYNANFLVMYETWEAAWKFLGNQAKPETVGKLLGWTRQGTGHVEVGYNLTAEACIAAHPLIQSGDLARSDFRDLSSWSVRELALGVNRQHRQVDKLAKQTNAKPSEVQRVKDRFTNAARQVASDIRKGNTPVSRIREQVNVRAIPDKVKPNEPHPFADVLRSICAVYETYFSTDPETAKLEKMLPFFADVESNQDREWVRRVVTILHESHDRLDRLETRIERVRSAPSKKLGVRS